MKTFYQCNYALFEKCKKTLCQEQCTLTTFKEYAKRDEFGNPIIAVIDNQERITTKLITKTENGRAARYCENCGNKVGVYKVYNFCPNCGAEVEE